MGRPILEEEKFLGGWLMLLQIFEYVLSSSPTCTFGEVTPGLPMSRQYRDLISRLSYLSVKIKVTQADLAATDAVHTSTMKAVQTGTVL